MSSQSSYITDILSKLNHPLDEVRCRAVNNITNKLTRKIITIDEICNYPNLPRYLLEIFNNENVSNPEQVLNLITLITEHENGAILLLNCGGFEFLSHLKMDCKVNKIIDKIDKILTHLMKINDGYKIKNENKMFYNPKCHKEKNNDINATDKTESFYNQEFGYFNDSQSSIGYTGRNTDNSEMDYHDIFQFCLFPTIPLTESDRNVLSGSLGTLRNDDFRVVLSGIHFFTDVILEDFPAPVFLQRQGALKVLLHSLSDSRYTPSSLKALLKFTDQMKMFINKAADINYKSTKNTYLIVKQTEEDDDNRADRKWRKDDMLELVYEPNLQTPVHLPVPVFCMQAITQCLIQIHELDSSNQLCWPHYIQLISNCFELLRCSVLTNSKKDDDLKRLLQLDPWNMSELMVEQLNVWSQLLMKYSIIEEPDLRPMINNRQIYVTLFSIFWQLYESLMTPDMALKFTSEKCQEVIINGLFDLPLATLLKERMNKLWEYVKLFNQQMAQLYGEIRLLIDSTGHLLHFFINYNEPIKFAEICIEAASQSLVSINFIYTQKFPKDFINLFSIISGSELFISNTSLLSKCDSILSRLLESWNTIIVKSCFTEIFQIISTKLSLEEVARSTKKTGISERKVWFLFRSQVFKMLIIHGLYSEINEVRETSSSLFVKLWDCKGVLTPDSWNTLSELTRHHLYLLHPLADTRTRLGRSIIDWCIRPIATGEFLNPSNQNDQDEILGNVLYALVPLYYHELPDVRREATNQMSELISLVNSSFHNNRSDQPIKWDCQVKVENLTDLLLINETCVGNSTLESLKTRWFGYYGNKKSTSGLDESNFQKVLEIFMSSSVDVSVRKSASEQLCIFLQNSYFHKQFIDQGGLNFVIQLIQGQLFDKAHASLLIPSCILIFLRLLMHQGISLVTKQQINRLLWQLIQLALYFCYDKQCLADISAIISLVIFYPINKPQNVSNNKSNIGDFNLPDIFQERIRLPFSMVTKYYKLSLESTANQNEAHHSLDFSNSLLKQYVESTDENENVRWKILHCIRLAWNLMKYGGLVNYTRSQCDWSVYENDENSLDRMKLIEDILNEEGFSHIQVNLTSTDQYLLHNTYPDLLIPQILYKIENATSHCQVEAALATINTQIVLLTFLKKPPPDCITNNPSQCFQGLYRFLINIPASSADYIVLDLVLNVLESVHTCLSTIKQKHKYLEWILKDILLIKIKSQSNSRTNENAIVHCLLRGNNLIGQTDSRRLTLVKVKLQSYLPQFLMNLIGLFSTNDNQELVFIDWIINLCIDRLLVICDTSKKPFDHLNQLFNWWKLLKSCMTKRNLIGPQFSLEIDNENDFFNVSMELIQTMSHESNIDACITFMGTGIIDLILRVFIGFFRCYSNQCDDNWCLPIKKSRRSWLLELLGYRAVEIRCNALILINQLIHFDDARIILLDQCTELLPEPMISVLLTLFHDDSEAPIVRGAAIATVQNFVMTTVAMDIYDSNINEEMLLTTILHFYNDNDDETIRKYALILIGYCSNTNQHSLIIHSLNLLVNIYGLIPKKLGEIFQRIKFNTILMSIIDSNKISPEHLLVAKQQDCDLLVAIGIGMKLLRIQIITDSEFKDNVLEDDKFIDRIIKMMRVCCQGDEILTNERRVWRKWCEMKLELAKLLVSIGSMKMIGSGRLLDGLIVQLGSSISIWFQFIRNLLVVKKSENKCVESNSIIVALQILIEYLSNNSKCGSVNNETIDIGENKTINKLVILLDKTRANQNEKNTNDDDNDVTMMMEICKIMMVLRDKYTCYTNSKISNNNTSVTMETVRNQEKLHIQICMKILCGVSDVAKQTFLDYGLVESINGEIKFLHTRLDKAISCTNSSTNSSLIWKQNMRDLLATLDILHNLLHGSMEAQSVAIATGIHTTLYRLWTVSQLDPLPNRPLHFILLNCLLNLSSSLGQKQLRTLVLAHQTHQTTDQPPCSAASSSIIDNITRLINIDELHQTLINQYHGNIKWNLVTVSFKLLSNLVWCPEGVVFLTRIRFLEKFTELNPNQLQKSKRGLIFQQLWLILLTSLSFTEEGIQGLINRISSTNKSGCGTEILRVLTGMTRITSLRGSALLVIRNLSTHSVVKQKLFVEGSEIMQCIQNCVEDTNPKIRRLLISMIKCLLYNNNKIRSYFKTTNLSDLLKELRDDVESQLLNEVNNNNNNELSLITIDHNDGVSLMSDIGLLISLFFDRPDHFKIK